MPPPDPFGGYQQNLARLKAAQPAGTGPDPLTALLGRIEPTLTLGSSFAGMVPAGLSGLATAIASGDAEEGAGAVQDLTEALTYLPQTAAGQENLASLVDTIAPAVEALSYVPEQAGGLAFDITGLPAAGAAAETFVDPLNALGPLGKGAAAATFLPARRAVSTLAAAGEEAPARALRLAEEMEGRGLSPEQIWQATGDILRREGSPYVAVGRGADGEWRLEVSDRDARILQTPSLSDYDQGDITMADLTLGSVLEHPDLYRASPESTDLMAFFRTEEENALLREAGERVDPQLSGHYRPTLQEIVVHPGAEDARSVLAHEHQHFIQDEANLARGGMPEEFQPDFETLRKAREQNELFQQLLDLQVSLDADPKLTIDQAISTYYGDPADPLAVTASGYLQTHTPQQIAALADEAALQSKKLQTLNRSPLARHERYRQLAGETEARNVGERRLDMDVETRRAFPPWVTEDIPRDEQQVVRGARNSPALSTILTGGR